MTPPILPVRGPLSNFVALGTAGLIARAAGGLILLAAATALYRLSVRLTVGGVLRPLAAAAAMAAWLFPLVGRVHVMILVRAGAAIDAGLFAISGGFPREFSKPLMSPEV